MRIEKGERVCYIIDRKGDTDVQVIAKPEKILREISEDLLPERKEWYRCTGENSAGSLIFETENKSSKSNALRNPHTRTNHGMFWKSTLQKRLNIERQLRFSNEKQKHLTLNPKAEKEKQSL